MAVEYPLPDSANLRPSWSDADHVYKVFYDQCYYRSSVAYQALNIIALCICCIVMLTVLLTFRRPSFSGRTAYRLSGTIVAYSMLPVATRLLYFRDNYTANQNQGILRLYLFLETFGIAGFVFSTACIAFHLHLTMVLEKFRLARAMHPWYELIVLPVAAIIAHPEFYIYEVVQRHKRSIVLVIVDKSWSHLRFQLYMMYCWMLLAIVYSVIVCGWVTVRLISIRKRSKLPVGGGLDQRQPLDSGMLKPTRDTIDTFSEMQPMVDDGMPDRTNAFDSDSDIANPIPRSSVSYAFGSDKPGAAEIMASDKSGNAPSQPLVALHEKQSARILLAIVRMALYPVITLFITPVLPIFMSIGSPTPTLQSLILYLPCVNVFLNAGAFMLSPCFDVYWQKLGSQVKRACWRLVAALRSSSRSSSNNSGDGGGDCGASSIIRDRYNHHINRSVHTVLYSPTLSVTPSVTVPNTGARDYCNQQAQPIYATESTRDGEFLVLQPVVTESVGSSSEPQWVFGGQGLGLGINNRDENTHMSPRAYDFHDSHHRHHQQQQQLPAYNPTQFRWLCNSVNEQSPFEHHGAAIQYTSLFTDDEFERSGTQAVSSLEQSTVSLYSQLPQQQRDPQHYRAKGPANIDETPFSGRAIL